MRYLSLDIETLGLDRSCSVLEVAFVEEDTDHPEVHVNDLTWHCTLFRHPRVVAEPYALNMHLQSGLWSEAQAEGLVPEEAWNRVRSYLLDYKRRSRDKHIVLAGENVQGFDLEFFPAHIRSLFHHRALDPGSMFFDPCYVPPGPPSLEEILARCGFGEGPEHRALSDARDVIRVIRHWLAERS